MEGELKSGRQFTEEPGELRRRIAILEEEAAAKNREIHAELIQSRENYRCILEASPN